MPQSKRRAEASIGLRAGLFEKALWSIWLSANFSCKDIAVLVVCALMLHGHRIFILLSRIDDCCLFTARCSLFVNGDRDMSFC